MASEWPDDDRDRIVACGLTAACCWRRRSALAGCNDGSGDPKAQIGANPNLPEPQQYLLPPMHIAHVVGWKKGETPTVAQGLKIQALGHRPAAPALALRAAQRRRAGRRIEGAAGTQPIKRPKDIVMGWIESWATSGGDTGREQPHHAAARRRWRRRARSAERLPRPSQLAVRRGAGRQRSLCRQHRRDRALPLQRRATRRSPRPATTLTPLPGGPIDHHWTKSLVASPDGTLLYVGVGSNSNITENGIEAEKNRAAIWEVDRATGALPHLRQRPAQSQRPDLRAAERRAVGRRQRARRARPGPRAGLPDLGEGRRLLRLALQLLRPACRSARAAAAAGSGRQGDPAGLCAELACRAAGAGVLHRQQSSRSPIAAAPSSASTAAGTGRSLNGYKVVFVPFSDGKPSGMAQDVVTGFLDSDDQARGRPVGLAVDKAGALLIADDVGNTVWRVTSSGSGTSPAARL